MLVYKYVNLELVEMVVRKIKELRKHDRSSYSSSVHDIEMSYENHGRAEVQKEIYKFFKITQILIKQSKLLNDTEVFNLIGPYSEPRTKGEVDVYLGIVSPSKWTIVDHISSTFHVINGSFDKCCESLENQKDNARLLNSPTTGELPAEFNYYSIFEVTHQSRPGHKLKQLESQLQYIVGREFLRLNKEFPIEVSGIENTQERSEAYARFMGKEILLLVCFAGLIMPYDFQEKEMGIIDLIKQNSGIDKPCLYALMENNRLMYLQSQTFSQRLEILESKAHCGE